MVQYVNKDALVAEIERIYEEHTSIEYRDDVALVLEDLEDFLDTLEVKEVDLENTTQKGEKA